LGGLVESHFGGGIPKTQWDWDAFQLELAQYYVSAITKETSEGDSYDTIVEKVIDEAQGFIAARRVELGPETMVQVEKSVMLSVIDNKWREHLSEMDYLRAGIGLRAMGQRDPLTEYQREGYDMFAEMVDSIKNDAIRYLFRVEIAQPQTQPKRVEANATGPRKQKQAVSDKIGRNEPCYCGSGKKYKKCHLLLENA
jgi:preprotein translocase subunit SecA